MDQFVMDEFIARRGVSMLAHMILPGAGFLIDMMDAAETMHTERQRQGYGQSRAAQPAARSTATYRRPPPPRSDSSSEDDRRRRRCSTSSDDSW
ncbi:hypothetical protein HaLaN_17961 [Haematococcus lacustris]|uniref:Uncharacterized protein n=1 Tax=Haematococcus lacustris TaxID=44745 RepID=A0A699ZDT8_HAELA|nr:hypothetical protein HaLaN_17961 [Haematococcus lacustris]